VSTFFFLYRLKTRYFKVTVFRKGREGQIFLIAISRQKMASDWLSTELVDQSGA